jgi:PAS domain S-box-containing protein
MSITDPPPSGIPGVPGASDSEALGQIPGVPGASVFEALGPTSPQRTLRFRLTLLVLACVLPVCVIAGLLVSYAYQQKRDFLQHSVLETTRALSTAVDQELAAMQASEIALATSPSLISGDLAALHRQALEVLHDYPADSAITLSDASGRQLVDTLVPLGTPLPRLAAWPQLRRVFETGKPVIINLYKGALTGRLIVGVAVPVFRDGQVKYALMVTVPAKHFDRVFSQRSVPPDWSATVLDGNRVLVTRNQLAERYAGLPAMPAVAKGTTAAAEGQVETVNRVGVSMIAVFSRAPMSGWAVTIGIPKAAMLAGLRHWLWWTVGGGLLLLTMGLVLALFLARRIAGSIRSLVGPALALGSGEPVDVGPLDLAETNEVSQSLAKASQLLQQRTAERDRAEQHVTHVASFPELNPNPIFETDLDGKVTYANPAAQKMLPDLLDHGANHPLLAELASVIAEFTTDSEQVIVREVAADDRIFLQTNYYLPQLKRVRVYFTDITERKQAEEQLQKLNRTLKALNDANQALLHATDEPALLQQVCRIVTEDCGHAMVWIGFAEHDENKTVRPVAHAGFEEGYLETLRITWADGERGRGPTGTAIRTGQPSTCRNMLTDPAFLPWREEAIKRGYACSLVLPLKEGDKVFGAITIYSREPDTFSEGEVDLLTELAANLAYGIGTLRMRAARAQADEALRESEARFRAFFETAAVGTTELDIDGRFTRVNQRFCQITGYSREELLAMGPADLTHPEDRDRDHAELASFQRGDTPIYDVEKRYVRKDGSVIWVQVRAAMIRDAEGKFLRSAGVVQDITERKRAEEALREQAELLDLAHDTIMVRGLDGTIRFWNRGAEEMYGFSKQQATGRIAHDLLWTVFPHPPAEINADLLRKGRWEGELIHTSRDGTRIVAASRWVLQRDKDGQAYGVMEINNDITARKRAQEELQLAKRHAEDVAVQLRSVVENMAERLYVCDSNGNLILMNAAFRGTYPGTDAPEFPRTFAEQWEGFDMAGNPVPVADWPIGLALRGQKVRGAEFRTRSKLTGEEMINSYNASPIFDSRGKVILALFTSQDITARKRAEDEARRLLAAVQQERDRLSALINSVNDEIWFADAENRFTLANPAALREFGAGSAATIDVAKFAESLEVYRPDGRPRPVEETPPLRALRGEVIKDEEEIVRTPATGELRHRQVSAAPVKDATGKIIGSVSVVRDITERKRADEALRKSDERYRNLFNTMDEGFCVIEVIFDAQDTPVDYRFLEINAAFERQTGLHEAEGKLMRDLAPAHETHWFEIYGKIALTGEPAHFVNQAKALNRWYEVYAYRVGEPERRQVGIVFNDITEIKRAEEALRQSEQRWATTLRSIGDAVISTCAQGKVIFMNEVAEKLTGWPLAEAQGRDLEEIFNIVNEVTRIKPENPVAKVIRMGQVVGLANHTALVSRDGKEIPIEDSGAPIRDNEGRVTGVVLVFHDISEKRRAEKAVRDSERLAMTGRMAASLAHEIHNPLDTVGNLLFLIDQNRDIPEMVGQHASMAGEELARVTQMTRHMLAFQREAKKPIPISIGEVLNHVIALYERKIESAGIKIEKQVDFEGDFIGLPGEMRQVVANLLGNALEAIGQNGKIRLHAYAGHDWRQGRVGLYVTVADNGPGIPDEIRDKIFDPFFTTKGEAGTGLGLWITSGIVEKYGGQLRLRSVTRAGRSGTCFSLFFPIN